MPAVCVFCIAPTGNETSLCAGCSADLPWNRPACPRCAEPMRIAGVACATCQRAPPVQDRSIVPLRHAGGIRELVHRFKFDADGVAGAVLADLLAAAVRDLGAPGSVDLLVPVPMTRAGIRRRGYNQAAILAARLARRLGRPWDPWLCARRGQAEPQRAMPDAAARRRNVRGAFAVRGHRTVSGSIAVVDDVVTTGSTVGALAAVLRRAGARRVEIWAPARGGSGVEVRD